MPEDEAASALSDLPLPGVALGGLLFRTVEGVRMFDRSEVTALTAERNRQRESVSALCEDWGGLVSWAAAD